MKIQPVRYSRTPTNSYKLGSFTKLVELKKEKIEPVEENSGQKRRDALIFTTMGNINFMNEAYVQKQLERNPSRQLLTHTQN